MENTQKEEKADKDDALSLSLLTLIRKVRSTSTLMSSLLLFPICQVFVMRFCKCCSRYRESFCPLYMLALIGFQMLYKQTQTICICVCLTKGIASTTECVICKTIPQHKIDAGVYRSRMKSNEWQGMRRAKDEVRGQRKQLNKSVSVKMERETKTALNVEINENSQAQTHTQSHAYAYMHTNRSLTHKMYKRDDKENRKHSKIFDTIIHSFGTNYGHKISAYVHKRPKSVELPLNFFLVFVSFAKQHAHTYSMHTHAFTSPRFLILQISL